MNIQYGNFKINKNNMMHQLGRITDIIKDALADEKYNDKNDEISLQLSIRGVSKPRNKKVETK